MAYHVAYPRNVAGGEVQLFQHFFRLRRSQPLLEFSAAFPELCFRGLDADIVDERGAFQQELLLLRKLLSQPDVP